MEDLSKIPEETMVKIRFAKPELEELIRILPERIKDAGRNQDALDATPGISITMTYAAWEALLTDVTAYMVKKLESRATVAESVWGAQTEIAEALIGLQEERLMRIEQGEG